MNTNTTRSYKDLVVWQKGIVLAKLIYQLTKNFPPQEKFGLVAQMRRAAVSIPSNIAEGQGRGTPAEFIRFLRIANGSRQEVETQTMLSQTLEFTTREETQPVLALCQEIGRLIFGVIRSLE